jgi:LPS sulfotransferase NodH
MAVPAAPFRSVAFLDELLADPDLLLEYSTAFAGRDDAELVVLAPQFAGAEDVLMRELQPVIEVSGLDRPDSAKVVVLTQPDAADQLAAHAVFGRVPRDGALAALPHVDSPAALVLLADAPAPAPAPAAVVDDGPLRYAICTTPRSGSNLLCDLLASSGTMGDPREFLNVQSFIVDHAARVPGGSPDKVPMAAFFDYLTRGFATPNGAFGAKLLYDQFEPLFSVEAVREFVSGCRLVWLVRGDVVAQAVSAYIAAKTGEWTSHVEDENRAGGEDRRAAIEYDFAAIDAHVKRLTRQNALWLEFFSANAKEFLIVRYEDLVADPEHECNRIRAFCGLDAAEFSLADASFKTQRTELNDRLAEQYRADSELSLTAPGSSSVTLRGIELADTPALPVA